jgi:hypothetical protein
LLCHNFAFFVSYLGISALNDHFMLQRDYTKLTKPVIRSKKNTENVIFLLNSDKMCLACSFFVCRSTKKEQAVGGVKREEEKSIVLSNPYLISFLAISSCE